MQSDQTTPKNIDEYIAGFPADIQTILQKIRAVIHAAAPEAQEVISYQMPTFRQEGNLVHFAAFKNHIGFYPTPNGIEQFNNRVAVYKAGKGSLNFPLDQPIPYDLISDITQYRLQENLAKAAAKSKKKK